MRVKPRVYLGADVTTNVGSGMPNANMGGGAKSNAPMGRYVIRLGGASQLDPSENYYFKTSLDAGLLCRAPAPLRRSVVTRSVSLVTYNACDCVIGTALHAGASLLP